MCILHEQFVCIYDFPALLLMSTGCFILVANSNFSDVTERDIDDILGVLLSFLFILYVVVASALGILGRHTLKNLQAKLLIFEKDARDEDAKNEAALGFEHLAAEQNPADTPRLTRANSILPDLEDHDDYDD